MRKRVCIPFVYNTNCSSDVCRVFPLVNAMILRTLTRTLNNINIYSHFVLAPPETVVHWRQRLYRVLTACYTSALPG